MEHDMVFPTHTCFDDAIDNLIWIMETKGRQVVARGDIKIVHAIVVPYGNPIAHAWIELCGKTVWFSGVIDGKKVLCEVEHDQYYRHIKVKEFTMYTLWEAYDAERRAGHKGPWEQKYRLLCND